MPTLSTLVLKLTGDNSGLVESLGAAESETESFGGKMGNILGGVGKAMAGLAIGGAVAVGGFLVGAIGDAAEAQDRMAQLEAVIKSTGGAAGMSAEAITDLAGSLQKTTKFSDDAITGGESLLLTFTNIGKDVFPDVTKTMLDMSTAMGTDLKGTAMQLGKALNDPEKGIAALTKSGVTFTEQQKEQIKAMQAAGDMAGAQKIVIAELNKEFGGSAEAAGKTFSGQMEIAKNMLGEFGEMIGGKILPIITPLIGTFIQLATDALPVVEGAVTSLMGNMGGLSAIFDLIGKAIGELVTGDFATLFSTAQEGSSIFSALLERLGVAEPVAVAVSEAFGTIATGIQSAISTVVTWVTDNWPKIQAAIMAGIGFIVSNVLPVAITAFTGLVDLIKVVVGWVVENWPLIQKTVETVIGAISKVITTVLPILRGIFETVFPIIFTVVKTAIEAVLAIITATMQLINGDTSGALDTLKGVFDKVWGLITTAATTAWNAVKQAVIDAVQGAIDWVNGIGNKLENIGKFMILGIVQGIKAAPGAVADALSGIVNGAITNIKTSWASTRPLQCLPALAKI